jgi:CRISPR-associated protein (TIGR02710 family)
MQHEPVVYSIRQMSARCVALICTPEAERETLNKVIEETRLAPSHWRKYLVPDDPEQIGCLCHEFQDAYRWLVEGCGLSRETIAADPTAGRKWMSAGATMVATMLGLAMHYVDAAYVDGKPDPSSMRLVVLGNAYDQTGMIAAEKGRTFFNQLQFATAADVFDSIQPTRSQAADLYAGLAALARALDKWERFVHYQQSLRHDFEAAFKPLRRHLNSQIVANPRLQEFVAEAEALANAINDLHNAPRPSAGFTVEVFENARRRIQQGRYDDACGRLYRALESLSQYYLEIDFGIKSDDPNVSHLSEEQREQIRSCCGENPGPIDLAKGYQVLFALGHRAGQQVVFAKAKKGGLQNKFDGLLQARNRSILAHGFEPIEKDRVDDLCSRLQCLLQNTLGDDFDQWSRRLRIPDLPTLLG